MILLTTISFEIFVFSIYRTVEAIVQQEKTYAPAWGTLSFGVGLWGLLTLIFG